MTPRKGRLAVILVLCPPDRRRRDIDNFQKGLFDAMTKSGVWEDDSQVDFLCVIRGAIDRTGGSVLFAVEDAGDPAIIDHIRDALRLSDLEGREIQGMRHEKEAGKVQAAPRLLDISADRETSQHEKRGRRATT